MTITRTDSPANGPPGSPSGSPKGRRNFDGPNGDSAAALARKVAFLAAMPGVEEVIETPMAHVFLTADYAFKLKKPVSFGYFDHRTLAARETACAAELRLNRALAGDVYIGTVALRREAGQLTLAGTGTVVDWLVHMRRLPSARMLDTVIAAGQGPSGAETAAVVAALVRFYRQQRVVHPPSGIYLAHLQREHAINVANLAEMAHHLPGPAPTALLAGVMARLAQAGPEIAAREAAGLVLEGHGDLRPEHVCLTDPPVIFDRVETALEMRVIDVFDEVGYLGAECAMLGRPDLGQSLSAGLVDAGFTPPPPWLTATCAAFRLVTRARLALDHLRDLTPRTPAKWPARARTCLDEATRISDEAGL